MRQTASNRRSRSRQGGKRSGGNTRSGGNRKESRGRGNPLQQVDRYKTMAREALQSGDRILAENYFQHAEHFQRLLNDRQGKAKDTHEPKQGDGVNARPTKTAQPEAKVQEGAAQSAEAKDELKPATKEPARESADTETRPHKSPRAKGGPKAPSRKPDSRTASDGNGATPSKPAAKGEAAVDAKVGEPSLQAVAFLNPTDARSEVRKGRKSPEISAKDNSPKTRAKTASKTKSTAGGEADEAAS